MIAIIRRDGTISRVCAGCNLLSVAASRRLAIEYFYPNPFAEALDMDFGGRKEIAIYDVETRSFIFRKKLGGAAGGSMSPDGRRLALVNDSSLSIYGIPQ